jgi:hypothetical protein
VEHGTLDCLTWVPVVKVILPNDAASTLNYLPGNTWIPVQSCFWVPRCIAPNIGLVGGKPCEICTHLTAVLSIVDRIEHQRLFTIFSVRATSVVGQLLAIRQFTTGKYGFARNQAETLELSSGDASAARMQIGSISYSSRMPVVKVA